MKEKIRAILVKHSDNKNANDLIEFELLELFADKINKINYPKISEVENILDKWSDRHEYCWDYNADRGNVKKAINSYKKLIINKNIVKIC